MTYSLCCVGNAVLVGHYPYNLLLSGAACSVFDKSEDNVGMRFWEQINELFVDSNQERHSVVLPLEDAPTPYKNFREWVLSEVENAGSVP